jgi:hypothetical protein
MNKNSRVMEEQKLFSFFKRKTILGSILYHKIAFSFFLNMLSTIRLLVYSRVLQNSFYGNSNNGTPHTHL